jgi:hypothetical protein
LTNYDLPLADVLAFAFAGADALALTGALAGAFAFALVTVEALADDAAALAGTFALGVGLISLGQQGIHLSS